MKPLARPADEFWLLGVVQLVIGLAYGLGAVFSEAIVEIVLGLVAGMAFFGVCIYLVAYRRSLRRAVESLRPAPTTEFEAPRAMRARVARFLLSLLVWVTPLAILGDALGLAAGVFVGNGLASLAASRWLARWEREHAVTVLREPRYRWRGTARLRGGAGVMDPRDYYVIDT